MFSGRRNDLPEFVPARSSEAFNSDRKVVKLLRRKIPEPNEMSERQIGLRRADNNVPLFRGTVEQVLDNRTLKPDSQEYIAPGNLLLLKKYFYYLICIGNVIYQVGAEVETF